MALADELGKLAELHANGGLTEEEFKRAKDLCSIIGPPPAIPSRRP